MSKHTPGPWSIRREGKNTVKIDSPKNISGRWDGLCKVFVVVEGKPDAAGEANARLIAAAPELLEALVALTRRADSEIPDPIDVPEIQYALRIIAKAKGLA